MSKNHTEIKSAGDVLREHGFRVTSGRVRLLDVLQKASKPLSIQMILSKRNIGLDQANLYRTLTDLADVGIVKRVDLNTGIAHFEYTPDRPHHHHAICTDCGTVEDTESCSLESLQKDILRDSSKFRSIYSHNLEFFGLCRSCSK